jgi:hypothetical protein
MNAHARRFTAALAVREQVPLLIGLMGPSGGGKTYSALRLATGIQSIVGGEIFGIDTEAKRMKHYADRFTFQHVPFGEPFGSEDYLEAIRFCIASGAKTIVIDSMSHEHEGVGGLLDFHEAELTRMAGDNYSKREAMKMLAWGKPKAARRKLINALLQMECNFIFCFRAKNTAKPVKVRQDNGSLKTEVVAQGFMPIAGEEFVFEMTLAALLLPGAEGVPTWRPEHVGEKLMSKLPEQFRSLATSPRAFDEQMGADLARWARGDSTAATSGQAGGDQSRARTQASTQDLPLTDRVAAYVKRVGDAPNLTKLQALKAASAILRATVEKDAPELLAGMDAAYEARIGQFEAAERARKPPLIERVASFKAQVDGAETTVQALRLKADNTQLWADVDAGDPDEVGTPFELESYVRARCSEIEAAEGGAE